MPPIDLLRRMNKRARNRAAFLARADKKALAEVWIRARLAGRTLYTPVDRTGSRAHQHHFGRQGTFAPDMPLLCERFRLVARIDPSGSLDLTSSGGAPGDQH